MTKDASLINAGAEKGAAVLAFLASAFMSFFRVADPDVWWHLNVGRLIWRTGGIPREEVFTWSIAGEPWQAFEWLHEAVLYALYAMGGFPALALGKALVSGIIAVLLLRMAGRLGATPQVSLAFVVGAMYAARRYMVCRPQLWDYMILTCFAGVLLGYLARPDARKLLVLPAASVLWANAHGGAFLLGCAMIGLAWLAAVIESTSGNRFNDLRQSISGAFARESRKGFFRSPLRILPLAFLGCLAAALLNPWGVGIFSHTWTLLHLPVLKNMTEWMRPNSGDTDFFAFWALGAASAIWMFRRKTFFALVVLFFSWLSLQAYRHHPYFFMLSAPLMAAAFCRLLERLGTRGAGKHIRSWATGGLVLIVFMGALGAVGAQHIQGRVVMGWGPGAGPRGAARFIRENYTGTRLFNQFEQGGYLGWALWPRHKPFIDGRAQTEYGPELIRLCAHWDEPESWGRLDRKYRFDAAILPNGAGYRCGSFDASRDWALVFWDDRALVYLRRTPVHRDLIAAREFRWLKPNDPVLRFFDELPRSGPEVVQVEKEFERSLRESQDRCVAGLMKMKWEMDQNKIPRALDTAREISEGCSQRSDVQWAFSLVRAKAGDLRGALRAVTRAGRIDPGQKAFKQRRRLLKKMTRQNERSR